jgi:hypothetical protein
VCTDTTFLPTALLAANEPERPIAATIMTEFNVIERHLEEIDVIRDLIIVTCGF